MIQITESVQPAQVLAFLLHSNLDEHIVEHYAIIRYLQPSPNNQQPKEMYECPFRIYEWQYNAQNSRQPLTAIIETSTISSPAFLTPVFNYNNQLPQCKNLTRQDKFWYIDRKFFDRAGWDDINTVNINSNIDFNDYEINLPENSIHGNILIDNVDDNSTVTSSNSDNSYELSDYDDNDEL
jgi:hypothetical protein